VYTYTMNKLDGAAALGILGCAWLV